MQDEGDSDSTSTNPKPSIFCVKYKKKSQSVFDTLE